MQFILGQQAKVGNQIRDLNWNPTPDLRTQMDSLIEAYFAARAAYAAACEECDIPVYVKPIF